MLATLTIVVMLIVAYAYMREGVFTAGCMLLNVFLAGLVAFNFWEPLASLLDPALRGGLLAGFEDLLALVFLFCVVLGSLRALTNKLSPRQLEFHGLVHQLGGAAFGLITGYLVAGFLTCVLQTIPWHENFMNFEPRSDKEGSLRSFLPADRAWLALMRYAGASTLSWKEDRPDADSNFDRYATFDRHGTFELRYQRYRRYGDKRDPLKYDGEFDVELGRVK